MTVPIQKEKESVPLKTLTEESGSEEASRQNHGEQTLYHWPYCIQVRATNAYLMDAQDNTLTHRPS